MSFTRFHDDPIRIESRLDLSTFEGRYQLNRPGPGLNMAFFEDPNLRLQKWGANLNSNTVNLESDLRGLSRTLNRDDVQKNVYQTHSAPTQVRSFPISESFVEESRSSHPAYLYRGLEQSVWEKPILDPQANLETPFETNVQTRLLRKNRSSIT